MRHSRVLILCLLCGVIQSSGQVAVGQNPTGFDREAHLTIGVTRNLFKQTNGTGLPAPPNNPGRLTAQLFDGAGSGEPIWKEVHSSFVLPTDDARMSLTLGAVSPFKTEAGGQPIPFNNSPYLLLTLDLDGQTYVTPRMAIAIAGYSHQAGAAYEAVGNLLLKIKDYEARITALEKANKDVLNKLHREVYGTDPVSQPMPK